MLNAQLRYLPLICIAGWLSAVPAANAQAPTPPASPPPQAMPYGEPISAERALKVAMAAVAEANRQKWTMAVAVYDSTAHLAAFLRTENTQYVSIQIAMGKAETAVNMRRPTKLVEDLLNASPPKLAFVGIDGVYPLEGGVPIIVGGKIVGSIGVSGGTSAQDAQVAQFAADTAKEAPR